MPRNPLARSLLFLLPFLGWNLLVGAALILLPPLAGLAVTLLLAAALLWGVVLRTPPGREARRRATLRLRPLDPEALRWTLIAVPVLLALSWALGEVYVRVVPVPPETLNPFEPIMERPFGRLAIAVLAVGVAPVMEEFFFRGLIQRTLERRWGAAAGIVGAAALFAVMHMLPRIFPLHLFLGIAFGYAVYAARSIWAGVALHAANNAAAMAGLLLRTEPPTPSPTLWEVGATPEWWASLGALAVTGAIAAWTARGLRDAGRSIRLRAAPHGG